MSKAVAALMLIGAVGLCLAPATAWAQTPSPSEESRPYEVVPLPIGRVFVDAASGSVTLHAFGEQFTTRQAAPSALVVDGRAFESGRAAERTSAAELEYLRVQLSGPLATAVRQVAAVEAAGSWYLTLADTAAVTGETPRTFDWTLVGVPGGRISKAADGTARVSGRNRAVVVRVLEPVGAELLVDELPPAGEGERALPRLRVRTHGQQARFVALIYPSGRAPARVSPLAEGLGAQIGFEQFTDTLSLAASEPADGPWWSFSRQEGDQTVEMAPLAAGPEAAQCPASSVEQLLAIGIVFGIAQSPHGPGVQVTAVEPDGPGAQAGLRIGDVIVACDGAPTGCPMDLIAALTAAQSRPSCTLTVSRGGQLTELQLQPVAAGR